MMMDDDLGDLEHRALAALEHRARKLSGAIYSALKADDWGAIEPTIFANVADDEAANDEDVTGSEAALLSVLMQALLDLDEE